MKKLIKECRNLDRKAQRKMVDHLSLFLFPICRRYTKTYEDAKDLLQEALILVFNNIHKCNSNEVLPFNSWCRRITINKALENKRKKGFEIEAVVEAENLNVKQPPILSQLNVEDILSLLSGLPQNQQIVFNLAIIDGYSHKEIAKLLSIKESSSRTFLTRARHTLQFLINKERQVKKVSE